MSRAGGNRLTLALALVLASWALARWGAGWLAAAGLGWAMEYPRGWVVPLADWISAAMKWLIEEAGIGRFGFKDLTRAIAWTIEQPYDLVRAALADGIKDGPGRRAEVIVPPLSWITITAMVMALGHYAKNWGLALVVGAVFVYLSVFGQWESAMVTLSSVIIAVPIGVGGGLWLGILAYRHPGFERVLRPVLDLMQTIPVFAYLVPILVLFGFGPVAALVATVIYAMPPMVRITHLALGAVSPEIRDFATMCGCTARQMTWRVLVPAARAGLMVGVNQVIMLSLNMVIIASMIGAGGLGFDVLSALRKLNISKGFESGIALVILAIALDRLSQALSQRAARPRVPAGRGGFLRRYRRSLSVLAVFAAAFLLGQIWPLFQTFPKAWWLSTGDFWDRLVKYLNVNYFDYFEAVKLFFLNWSLLPAKRFLLGLPWPWAIFIVTLAGWALGGWRLGLTNLALAGFILITGMWEKAMITLYLTGISVFVASAIGVPLGILAASFSPAGRVIGVVIDTLQTLPSFVYLIPVVMLFRIGDFTAMVAIVLYALVPAVRYAAHGVRAVSPELIEAGVVAGCTRLQLLTRIRLPLALPELLLGLNQTIMLALSMLVITALVGTRDLGQEVYIALTKADVGHGLVAGLAIACIAIIADRIVTAGARAARARYGLEETDES